MRFNDVRPKATAVWMWMVVLGLLIYGNAIFHPFVHDDLVFIVLNPHIARWDNLVDAFVKPQLPFQSDIATPYYRPFLEVLYRLEHAVWGMNSAGFHAVNVALHILNSYLAFVVARLFGARRWMAWAAATVFLVHPVQTEAVACIAGISNLAVTFWLLVSTRFYLTARGARRRRHLWVAGACFVAALLCKEQAAFFPLFVFVYECGINKRSAIRLKVQTIAVFAILLLTYFAWRSYQFPAYASHIFDQSGESLLRIGSIARIVLIDLGLLVWPANLHYYRSVDILQPHKFLAWLVLAIVVSATVIVVSAMCARHKKIAVTGLLWGGVFMLPCINIVPLVNEYSLVLAAEHFLYLSLAGFTLSVLTIAQTVLTSLSRRWGRDLTRLGVGLLIMVVIVFSALTVYQNRFWRSEIALFTRMLQFEPHFGRGQFLLADAYLKDQKMDAAIRHYTNGLRIMEEYAKKSRRTAASSVYLQLMKSAYFNRGTAYLLEGDIRSSSADYLRSLRIDGGSAALTRQTDGQMANQLAFNYLRLGDLTNARRYWQVAARLDPAAPDALNNLGMLALQRDDHTAAVYFFRRVVKRHPEFRPAAVQLQKLKDFKE